MIRQPFTASVVGQQALRPCIGRRFTVQAIKDVDPFHKDPTSCLLVAR